MMIRVIKLVNNLVLISKIEELNVDIGEPDCKLIQPFFVEFNNNSYILSPWMVEYTEQSTLMISSDKILTIVEPNTNLLKKYEELIN
jgi:hypothetical protein